MPPFPSFDAFYTHYLQAHTRPWNRRVHLLGWILGALTGLYGVWIFQWWPVVLAPVMGLGAILLGHGFIEPSDEVEFKYPLWTARANLRMFADMARGHLPW